MSEAKKLIGIFTDEFELAGEKFIKLTPADQQLMEDEARYRWDLIKRAADGEDVTAQMQMSKSNFASAVSIQANIAETAFNDAFNSAISKVLGALITLI